MIAASEYDKMCQEGNPGLIEEFFSDTSVEEKDRILMYLKKWDTGARAPNSFYDVLTGKPIGGEYCLYCDGEFVWETNTVYYFEKYNLKLTDEFLKHVLSQDAVTFKDIYMHRKHLEKRFGE